MQPVTVHDISYHYFSWQELGDLIFSLAQKVITSEQQFDRVIALAKGGLTFSRSLVDYLNVPDVSTLKVEFYTGINATTAAPVITQSLPVSVRDERVLVFDDIVDKGDTMKVVSQYLQFHGVKSLTTAALVSKPWADFKVDFAASESVAWVIFPNESRETIEILTKNWREVGDSSQQIRQQLLEIGFPQAEVALFANLD